jgi:phenylpyruvate tautomerase PptA (4-oxalocrotonate tautomerase family)
MPLWKVYHPVDAFTPEDKKGIAQAITNVYGRVMPRFYVGVIFQEVKEDSCYVGGEPHGKFVRIWIDHIARAFAPEDSERKAGFMRRVNQLLEPYIKDRGFDWELHVDETPFDLWTIQGLFPPREGTEDEKRWMAENRPSPRTHG